MDGVRLAHVNGELQRDDVPSLLARLRDAPESWFERVGQGQRAPATALLALRRVVLPWILAGLPVALALATLLWLARGGRPRRRWVTHAAWLAALWLATSAALAPAFLPMVQVR